MAINAINSIDLFQTRKAQGYVPAAIPSESKAPSSNGNPFAEGIGEVAQIGIAKNPGFKVGLGGTNNPTETLGNRLMISA